MTPEQEVEKIKDGHFAELRKRDIIILVKADYGYEIRQMSPTGVCPTSGYDTPQEAGARALQLLGIKEPVTPQDRPEVAGFGDTTGGPPPPEPKVI